MSARASLRLQVARRLEEGAWNGPVARVLSRGWSAVAARSLARPLVWSEGVRVITVGGATLGGSGKTPLAIACARALAEGGGARVVLVAHAYGARPGETRVVRGDDALGEVGDEAIVAARALAGIAQVVVAPSRQAALDHATHASPAAPAADVIVLDGVLQTAPARASLALLALDAQSPWGAGEVVPRGDLRASRAALLAACDGAVTLGDADSAPGMDRAELCAESPPGVDRAALCADSPPGVDRAALCADSPSPDMCAVRWSARVHSRGAFVSGGLLPWSALSPLRLGLFLALARPGRLLASLARRGVIPHRIVRIPDHGVPQSIPLSPLLAYPSVDLWLASPKCALHLEAAGVPHAVLDHTVELGAGLLRSLMCARSVGAHLVGAHAHVWDEADGPASLAP